LAYDVFIGKGRKSFSNIFRIKAIDSCAIAKATILRAALQSP
jgi:hypothetical protein